MQKLVFRNANGIELDLTSDPFGITEWEGFSADDLNIQSQQVPFQDGAVFLDALLNERELSVTVAMYDRNNLATRYSLRREIISKLNPKLGEGLLIYTNDILSKQIHCIPQMPVFQNHNSNDLGTPKVKCSFTACNPYWEDLEETIISIPDKESTTIANNGDVPVGVKVKIKGSSIGYPLIQNSTTGKQIKFSSEFFNEIDINTNVGQKEAYEIKNNYTQVTVGGDATSIAYVPFLVKYFIGTKGLLESIDGETWTMNKNFPSNEYITSISYSEELGIICIRTRNKNIYASQNGVDFEKVYTLPQNAGLYDSIAYSRRLRLFCTISQGKSYISKNGFDWEISGTVNANYGFRAIAYSEELQIFVIAGSGNRISTSPDGATWTEYTVTGSLPQNKDVIIYSYLFHKFIIAGSGTNNGSCIESSDGTNWTCASGVFSYGNGITSLCEGNNCIIGASASGAIFRTVNGSTWTRSEEYYIVDYGRGIYNNRFYFAGKQGVIKKSSDGLEWEVISPRKQNYTKMSAVGNNIYITGEQSISKYTQTGVRLLKQIGSGNILNICAVESIVIAIGGNGIILTSSNDTDWTSRTSGTENNLNGICHNGIGEFVVVGDSGTILKSTDGINWASQTSGTSENLIEVCYSQQKALYVAVGANGTILTSSDGATWTSRTSNVTTQINDIIYSADKELFVAVTNAVNTSTIADILTSSNGTTWNKQSGVVTNNIIGVAYSETKKIFYAITNDTEDNILTSANGLYWTLTESIGNTINDVLALGEYIYVCGVGGTLYTDNNTVRTNIISDLSSGTDMTLGLATGENQIMLTTLTGDTMAVLSFRQKYIGV